MNSTTSALNLPSTQEQARSKWGWFVALGVLFLILGTLAFGNLLTATIATVYYIGALMVVGAIVTIVHAFQVKSWSSFFAWLLSGALYCAAGVLIFNNPLLAASTLTLVLALVLIASGVMRIWSSIQMRPSTGWAWMTASGVATLLAGMVFLVGWPINTLWLLGMMLAFELTFQGISMIAFGASLNTAD
jgi:uncharacterized membrane protein HdeD (DUF308 family)